MPRRHAQVLFLYCRQSGLPKSHSDHGRRVRYGVRHPRTIETEHPVYILELNAKVTKVRLLSTYTTD